MKIRSYNELESSLNQDLSWRKHELSSHKSLMQRARTHEVEYLSRAGIAMLYAHWEGFIKFGIQSYLKYIEKSGTDMSNATDNIKMYILMRNTFPAFQAGKHAKVISDAYNILQNPSHACIKDLHAGVSARSNLNTEVLDHLIFISGLDGEFYDLKRKLIDYSLVEERNKICHGDRVGIEKEQFLRVYKEIVELIDILKEKILDAASQKKFKIHVTHTTA